MNKKIAGNLFFENIRTKDYLEDLLVSKTILEEINKFHQSSVYYGNDYLINNQTIPIVNEWMKYTEYTDVIPNYVNKEVYFNINKDGKKFQSSIREFDKEYTIPKDEFGEILYCAFGRNESTRSKRYPSAGALYPVFPVILVLSDYAVEDVERGSYVFDSNKNRLLQIKEFAESDIERLYSAIFCDNNFPSNVVIGYAIDLKRAIAKYRKRGYRHSLIEVGLLSQSLREAYIEINSNKYGDFCMSGFSDNQLTYTTGLNVKNSPIVLLQWIGKKENKNDIY